MALKAERERTVAQHVDVERVLGNYIPLLLETMKHTIGSRCDFTPREWKDAERLLQCCALAVCEHDFDPAHAKEIVRELGSGYTSWLTWVERGLVVAVQEVPDPQHLHAQVWGAFRMMKAFLYDVDVMTHDIPRGRKSRQQREEAELEEQFARR